MIQGVALVLVALTVLASMLIYNQLNKEIYIEYQESSSVKYSVKIPKDAPFYSDYLEEFKQYADENGDLWIPSDHAYPTMAATMIKVDLNYQLNMGTPDVDYEYTYKIFAHPEIVDSGTKNKFPMPKTTIASTAEPVTQSSNNKLSINKPIEIDYHYYNTLVQDFESKMGIKNATENLIITMQVEVIGSSEVFENNSENTYTITVSIPLNDKAFDVNYSTSSGQGGDCKILARKNSGNQHIYRGAAIVLGAIEAILFITFIAFVFLTRNHYVNYSIKVQRLLNSYRSFIQRVVNGFDTEGYQILEIASFKEMLAIRDTIQSPVLMNENTDQTRTQFFIPTNTKILYVYDIKVDNYDELYGENPDWEDDSIIDLDVYNDKNTESENTEVDPMNIEKPALELLYAEIDRLRKELAAAKGEAVVSEAAAEEKAREPQILTSPTVSGPFKFGHFNTGGNVTINYNENNFGANSDERVIKEAAKILATSISTQLAATVTEPCAAVEVEPVEAAAEVVEAEPEVIEAEAEVAEAEAEVAETEAEVAETEAEVVEAEAEVVEAEAEAEVVEAEAEVAKTEAEVVEAEAEVAKTEAEVVETEAAAAATVDVVIELDDEDAAPAAPAEGHPEPIHVDLDHVLNDLTYDDEHGYFIDEQGEPLKIQCRRSFMANIIQSDDETVKSFYSELKNYVLSFKGVKSRMSWRYEAFKRGRDQLLRVKIRGKSICLYCALDPEQFDKSKYFHTALDSKMFECVPMLVKIKSARGLKRALQLVDAVMEKFGIEPNPKATKIDYVAAHPYEKTKALVENGLIKILDSEYVIVDHK